jgi:hypothetical protein
MSIAYMLNISFFVNLTFFFFFSYRTWNGTLERRLECLNMLLSFMGTREDLKLNIENENVVKANSQLMELRSKLTI